MSGKDNPSPTPAPQIIAPIKTISNTSSLNLFFTLKKLLGVYFVMLFGFVGIWFVSPYFVQISLVVVQSPLSFDDSTSMPLSP